MQQTAVLALLVEGGFFLKGVITIIIKLSSTYRVLHIDEPILGYIGEHNARTITFENLSVEGADHYRLRIEYTDRVSYEVEISEGSYTVTGSLLRSVQKVKAQIYAVKTDENGYELVKKSNIFHLVILPSLRGTPAAIPSFEASKSYLDEIMGYVDRGEYGDYTTLAHKPSIEGEELLGDKTLEDFGLESITSAELAAMWE